MKTPYINPNRPIPERLQWAMIEDLVNSNVVTQRVRQQLRGAIQNAITQARVAEPQTPPTLEDIAEPKTPTERVAVLT